MPPDWSVTTLVFRSTVETLMIALAGTALAVVLNRNGHEWPVEFEPPEQTITNLRELDELLAASRRDE